jgi:hypothetical protein
MAQRARFRALIALAAALAAASAVGCAHAAPAKAPAPAAKIRPDWFTARSKALDAKGFPNLSAVPRASGPGRSDGSWSALATDLRSEGDTVLASPRNVPADLKDLEGFEAEARKAATPPPALGTPMTPRAPSTTP